MIILGILILFLIIVILTASHINLLHICLYVACLLGSYLFLKTKKPFIIVFLIFITTFGYSYSLRLLRPLESIKQSSPAIEFLQKITKGKFRYAFVGEKDLLPPNQEILYRLKSIHSYDSLSPKAYQYIAKNLDSIGTTTYGRLFTSLSSIEKLSEETLSYTGISVLISKSVIPLPQFRLIHKMGEYLFYQKNPEPMLFAQVQNYAYLHDMSVKIAGALTDTPTLATRQREDFDDFQSFTVTPAQEETILFLSCQYHPQWIAHSGGKKLKTVVINDFYLGVVIPKNTAEVEVVFHPFVRYMWISQLMLIFTAGILLVECLRRKFLKRI